MKCLRLFAAVSAFAVASAHARDWITLNDCVYVANPANDGDSFHVKADGKEYIFRLYFVDAPEIESVNAQRLVQQAKYFGITVPEVIELGRAANAFVGERLTEPFSVTTRFAHAMARGKAERFLAFVTTKNGDLGEQLVARGLARIFGTPATRPGAANSAVEGARLAQLENEAKQTQAGGWSAKAEHLVVRDEKSQADISSKAGLPPATAAATAHQLDVNRATRKQLIDLPGVGPTLADRIIAARPLKSADDLLHVDGIGRKKYAAIRQYFE